MADPEDALPKDLPMDPSFSPEPLGIRLRQLAKLFFRLGSTGFGGPQAHIAMQNEAAVQQYKWISEEDFLAGVAICEMLPGPASTQMGIFIGYWRAGILGALVAGCAFIFPAYVIELILSWAYFRYQQVPQLSAVFLGIAPVVIAIILAFCFKLGRKAIKSWIQMGIAIAAFFVSPWNVFLTFIGAGIVGLLVLGPRTFSFSKKDSLKSNETDPKIAEEKLPTSETSSRSTKTNQQLLIAAIPGLLRWSTRQVSILTTVSPDGLSASSFWGLERISEYFWPLALFFLKVGSAVFGGGLVIIPFISTEVVDRLGWMTQTEFLDGVAIGQFTPGPVVLTAAFIGYRVAGFWGSLVASVAIFLPSFLFIMTATPVLLKVRQNPWIRAALKGITPAALGAIAAATVGLGRGAFVQESWPLSILTVVIAGLALIGLVRFRIPTWALVPMGAGLGWVIGGWVS